MEVDAATWHPSPTRHRSRRHNELAAQCRIAQKSLESMQRELGMNTRDPVEDEVDDRIKCIRPVLRHHVSDGMRGHVSRPPHADTLRRNVASHEFGVQGISKLDSRDLRLVQKGQLTQEKSESPRYDLAFKNTFLEFVESPMQDLCNRRATSVPALLRDGHEADTAAGFGSGRRDFDIFSGDSDDEDFFPSRAEKCGKEIDTLELNMYTADFNVDITVLTRAFVRLHAALEDCASCDVTDATALQVGLSVATDLTDAGTDIVEELNVARDRVEKLISKCVIIDDTYGEDHSRGNGSDQLGVVMLQHLEQHGADHVELALVSMAFSSDDISNFGFEELIMGSVCSHLQSIHGIDSPWHLDYWVVENVEIDNVLNFRAKIVLGNFEEEVRDFFEELSGEDGTGGDG